MLFAAAGIFIAMETAVPTFQSWQAMRAWQPTSALLVSVSVSENSTQASYRYQVEGVSYQGDRVYVADFNDNIGSYHQQLYKRLQGQHAGGEMLSIWYDPENPAQAVIDRDMRWGLFALMTAFCSVFILLGSVVCYASLKAQHSPDKPTPRPSLSQLRQEWQAQAARGRDQQNFLDFLRQKNLERKTPTKSQAKAADYPSPWLNKKEWRNNRIRSNAKSATYFMWIFAILWNAISSPILFVLDEELRHQNYAALLGLLFPLVGVILLFKAWRMTQEWRRFGVIELSLDPFPGALGGHVGGRLLIAQDADFQAQYRVELECVHSYMSGSGDNRHRHESIQWSEQGLAKTAVMGRSLRLEFRFDVPADLPEADVEQTGNYYFWRLQVSGECHGVSLKREYNIPVFQTDNQTSSIHHDISAKAAELRKEQSLQSSLAINSGDFEHSPLAGTFEFQDTGMEQTFYYPMFRNKMLTLIALIFAGGFDFASYSINHDFGAEGFAAIGMGLFSLPFALVGLLASIAAIYLPFNNLKLTLKRQELKVLRRWLFIPISHHVLDSRDIKAIQVKSTGSTGSGAKQTKHFALIVHSRTGRKFTIAEDIDGQTVAEQLKQFIAKRLDVLIR